jgi:hypothetical protein
MNAETGIADTNDKDAYKANCNMVSKPHFLNPRSPDFNAVCPMFAWLDPKIIEVTFEHSTQMARLPMGMMMKHAFKSASPALNIHVTDVYGIKIDKHVINTLKDNICKWGAPTKLISDCMHVDISKKPAPLAIRF